MNIGIIGLGRIGSGIAYRLKQAGHTIIGYDPSETAQQTAAALGINYVQSLQEVANHARIIWLLIPAGTIIDTVIEELKKYLRANDIIVDGGNSHFKDSQQRAKRLEKDGIFFLDCGTSGGIHGKEKGFCLMIGGNRTAYDTILPLLQVIATCQGCAYIGRSGTGHYVKMVHNGIEYALLQAYAEGFQLMQEGSFKHESLDFETIANLWNHGSIIRSWILDLVHTIFQEQAQDLSTISGKIGDNGTGRWTVEEAHQHTIPVQLIENALKIRFESQKTEGTYATKIVALLRNKFGGHELKKHEVINENN